MTENLKNPHPVGKVFVDDNFHYMDEDERYLLGEFDSREEAVAVCKKIVDDFLSSQIKPGITAEDLFQHYSSFGEDPIIVGDDSSNPFSALDYAKERCAVICGSGVSSNEQSA